jgi:hypothetical protein
MWRYAATESDLDPLHATVSYKHGSVADLQAYREANKQMAEQLAQEGGDVRVSISLRQPSPAKELIQHYCQDVWAMQRKAGGTEGIGPPSRGPLAHSEVDQFLDPVDRPGFAGGDGIFGIDCTVDSKRLGDLLAEPLVFLVDVTPTWVRRDLARAGVVPASQVPVMVDFAYGWMLQFGMVPTVPPPVGTITPKEILPAP